MARLSLAKSKSTIKVTDLNDLFKSMPECGKEDMEGFRNILQEIRSMKDEEGFIN